MTRSLRERLARRTAGADGEAPSPDDEAQWYVVHTYSGYENKVRQNLLHRVETMDVADRIFDIIVPTQDEIEIKSGQRQTVQRKVFPGYVLVKMKMDDDSWYVVRNTPGVTSFVGMGNKPTALAESEVQSIIKGMHAEAPKVKVTLSVGDAVRINDGPFADFRGVIDEINQEKGKIKVLVSFFGREVPVELDFLQVEREG
jgi:transcriptional antiterminator NusG